MALAIFDLDNTLLNGDSDYLWGEYLCDIGAVNADIYHAANERFYEEYRNGTLDIFEFLEFSLKPLNDNSPETLYDWRTRFMRERIMPVILDKGRQLVASHRERGDTLLIITATNRFVTAPIAAELGIENLLASEPEIIDGRYTGKVSGTPCYQQGKITNLHLWLEQRHETLEGSTFYSDSHNDLPLLQEIAHPVAVDPDDALRKAAEQAGWPIISLRD